MNKGNQFAPLQDGIVVSSEQFGDSENQWRVRKETLVGGLQEGVELIHVDGGRMNFTVIPTRGMSLYRATCDSISLGWDSPIKPIVHPQFINLNDDGGLGWLAGFNELMVRCGVAFAGHPGMDGDKILTLHGRIGNTPADCVEVVVDREPPHRIRVRGRVEEAMFKFGLFELWTEVSTIPGSRTLRFCDRLVNRSEYEQEYQIIYHTNIGRPLLEASSQFHAAIKSLAPLDEYAAKDIDTFQTYLGPTANYGEQVYCATLHADERETTTSMLQNAAGDRGVALSHGTATLPYFTLWKNTDTETDGYVTGLEPGTGFPFNRSVERDAGRVPRLAAGAEVSFQMEMTVLEDAAAVKAMRQRIDELQAGRAPQISHEPPK